MIETIRCPFKLLGLRLQLGIEDRRRGSSVHAAALVRAPAVLTAPAESQRCLLN